MTHAEAVEFIRPGVTADANAFWADLGAGSGTFTRALAQLLGGDSRVLAVERDPRSLKELRLVASPRVQVVEGDVTALDSIAALRDVVLDGALLANVLHFIPEPAAVLTQLRGLLRADAAVLVIEYDRRGASGWVPYPLPLERLAGVAQEAGFAEPVEVNRRASQYQGSMYCARIVRA